MQLTEDRSTARTGLAARQPAHSAAAVDLFDTYQAWRSEPIAAFEAWVRRRDLSDRSRGIYINMWQRLVRWMEQRHPDIGSWSLTSLNAFLEGETLPNHHRTRYRLLIERVFNRLGELGHTAPNPAHALLKQTGSAPIADRATQFLSRADRSQLIAHCERCTDALLAQSGADAQRWVQWRDLALVALTLGAGLKVYDLQRISVSCIDVEEAVVRVRPKADFRAPLLPFAVAILREWLQVHNAQGFDPAILFPAARRKGAFSPRQPGKLRMHESSMFRRIRLVLSAAGIEAQVAPERTGHSAQANNPRIGRSTRICGQTLRNAYASTLFDAGLDDGEVMLRLGLQRHSSAQRLRASWSDFLASPADASRRAA